MKKILFSAVSALAITGVAVAADSTQFGAMQVLSTAKRTLVAIPWDNTQAGGGDIAVSNLVLTANLTEGDTLDTLKSDGSRLNRWRLDDNGSGVLYWQSVTQVSEDGKWEKSDPPDQATVERGSSVILIRQAFTNNVGQAIPFFVMGQVASGAPTATIVAGESGKPVYNMIAPPSVKAQKINGVTWETSKINQLDRIYIPGATGLDTELMYASPTSGGNATWCEKKTETTIVHGKTKTTTKLVASEAEITLGTGFWYVSQGGNPSVTWGDLPQ